MNIGIDLGGTNIVAGLIDFDGKVLLKKSKPTINTRTPDEIIKDIIYLVKEIISENVDYKEKIKGIGIGIPGIADNEGLVLVCVNLNWRNVPLKEPLEKGLGLPVFIENDATLAGLAEFELGIMKNAQSGVFITLGTGIGGGVIIDGKVISGYNNIGSEIGHMIVGDNFYTCNCGRVGCLETFSSSTGLIKYILKLLKEGNDSILLNSVHGKIENINGQMIFDAAINGDEVALMGVDRLIKYLAIGIMNVTAIIDPEIFAIGGGLSGAGEFLMDKLKYELDRVRYFNMASSPKVELAILKNDAGIIGAGFWAAKNLD